MMTNYSEIQLQEGLDAWRYIAAYQAAHETIPPNFRELLELPLDVKNPITGESRVVLIRNLTPGDIHDWIDNDEIEAHAKHFAETLEGK